MGQRGARANTSLFNFTNTLVVGGQMAMWVKKRACSGIMEEDFTWHFFCNFPVKGTRGGETKSGEDLKSPNHRVHSWCLATWMMIILHFWWMNHVFTRHPIQLLQCHLRCHSDKNFLLRLLINAQVTYCKRWLRFERKIQDYCFSGQTFSVTTYLNSYIVLSFWLFASP